MTCEKDWPARFRRDSSAYASRSMVIVFTAMHGSCTEPSGMSRRRTGR
jgi:hypothetical protein